MNKSWKCSIAETALNKLSSIFKMSLFSRQSDDVNEVLFYGSEQEDKTKESTGLNNLLCIYFVIKHAYRTIDICIPSFISDTLAQCLIYTQEENKVTIRIALYGRNDLSDLAMFARHGFEVKVITSAVPLEHEFILIDAIEDFREAVAIMGSLDYDAASVNCNRDSTLLTSEQIVVKSLKLEFERVWNTTSSLSINEV